MIFYEHFISNLWTFYWDNCSWHLIASPLTVFTNSIWYPLEEDSLLNVHSTLNFTYFLTLNWSIEWPSFHSRRVLPPLTHSHLEVFVWSSSFVGQVFYWVSTNLVHWVMRIILLESLGGRDTIQGGFMSSSHVDFNYNWNLKGLKGHFHRAFRSAWTLFRSFILLLSPNLAAWVVSTWPWLQFTRKNLWRGRRGMWLFCPRTLNLFPWERGGGRHNNCGNRPGHCFHAMDLVARERHLNIWPLCQQLTHVGDEDTWQCAIEMLIVVVPKRRVVGCNKWHCFSDCIQPGSADVTRILGDKLFKFELVGRVVDLGNSVHNVFIVRPTTPHGQEVASASFPLNLLHLVLELLWTKGKLGPNVSTTVHLLMRNHIRIVAIVPFRRSAVTCPWRRLPRTRPFFAPVLWGSNSLEQMPLSRKVLPLRGRRRRRWSCVQASPFERPEFEPLRGGSPFQIRCHRPQVLMQLCRSERRGLELCLDLRCFDFCRAESQRHSCLGSGRHRSNSWMAECNFRGHNFERSKQLNFAFSRWNLSDLDVELKRTFLWTSCPRQLHPACPCWSSQFWAKGSLDEWSIHPTFRKWNPWCPQRPPGCYSIWQQGRVWTKEGYDLALELWHFVAPLQLIHSGPPQMDFLYLQLIGEVENTRKE